MEDTKPFNLTKAFILFFVLTLGTTLIVYKIFDFEISVLYCISVSAALIGMGLIGLENVVTWTKK